MTARPSGAFDTSARLDATAAQMRNSTTLSRQPGQSWDNNHSGTTAIQFEITDRPDELATIGCSAID
jgi:hypothetical protein